MSPRCAALTGSRDSTSYGASVTGDIAYGLAQRGIFVISGLAYGIDAHAHRAALAVSQCNGPATIAVLAGGLDRAYLSGNADLGGRDPRQRSDALRIAVGNRPAPIQVPAAEESNICMTLCRLSLGVSAVSK
jgi:hypothetical protein